MPTDCLGTLTKDRRPRRRFFRDETIKNVDDALLNFMFRMLPPASPPPFLPFDKSTHTYDESAPA